MISHSKPREGDTCTCGNGYLVEKDDWLVCVDCGGATTPSRKYLPPQSGWSIPELTDEDRSEAYDRLDREETERNFWRQAFG